jgi:putative tryptophan/tyrosine transport system substrate-binding protein
MERRVFLAGSVALLAAPLAADAQKPEKVWRVGYLATAAPTAQAPSPSFEAFRHQLADLGYVEGRNIVIEARWAEGRTERLPELAAELVELEVDVIAATGAIAARAVQKVTTTIPIVAAVVVDPVAAGLVSYPGAPRGNLTALTTFHPQQARAQLELLKQAIPQLARVAFLSDRELTGALLKLYEEQAQLFGLESQSFTVPGRDPNLDGTLEAAKRRRADAIIVFEQPATISHRRRIAEVATKYRMPTLFARDSVDAGGLFAYGASLAEAARRMALVVDKLMRGASPADIPVELVNKFDLVINLKTAKALGLTIPPSLLLRADQVIE